MKPPWFQSRDPRSVATKHRDLSIFKMVLIFHQWRLVEFLILLICVVYFGEAKKHIKENDGKCWRAYLPV